VTEPIEPAEPVDPFPPTGTDAAGVPVIDVPVARWREAALHARDELAMDFVDQRSKYLVWRGR